VDCSFLPTPLFNLLPIMMLIKLGVRMHVDLLRVGGLNFLKCKKQDHVSKSSTKAEYRALSAACSEIVWLCSLLKELGFS